MGIQAGMCVEQETFKTCVQFLTRYFKDSFLPQKYASKISKGLIDIFVVKNANHIYSLTESQDELFNRIFTWLSARAIK